MLKDLFLFLREGSLGTDFGLLQVQLRLRQFIAELFQLVRLRITLENLPLQDRTVVLGFRTVALLFGGLDIFLRFLLRGGIGVYSHGNLIL